MKIGLRTIKTALGAGISIWIAELLHLQFASFAAIICILCIEKTKKQSIRSSLERFAACTLSLVFSGLVFRLLGFNPLVFSLFILLFIPLLVRLRIQKGFVNSVVIVLHIFTLEKFTLPVALNEIQIVMIGVGVAILLNSYMPNVEKNLKETKAAIEEKFKKILFEFGAYLEKGDQGWDGKELLELEDELNKGKMLAIQYEENQLGMDKKGYYHYFDMRERQFIILNRMLPIVSSLNEDVVQRHVFAQFLYEISSDVKSDNTAYVHLQRLESQHKKMKELELPKSRLEFETRASVFHLMNEMEYYLITKMNYYDENQINV
ncbi:aromatic acid exporter family protein [Bacillus sp. BRMEA1]|uniref:aromatic acid exporter family protein n=1 Tax=Neobacillus endophyticus TaxID=2738405 RepID=UPI00156431C5|nr:aromatic acid exporter family protein [Neobacillus endophyticus]NRD80023.1 aromatic acid exporter family protein [Neobacillus endophyticus]